MPDPVVSVVLPTFNRADTLARAIQSVLAQSYDDLELIVVDDASADATGKVVAGFSDPRVRLVRNHKNLGVSQSRNVGIGLAKGELIAFQDSDDEWRVEKLAKQVAALLADASGVSLVVCGDLCLNYYPMSYLGVAGDADVVDVTQMALLRLPGAPCWLAPRAELLAAGGFDQSLNCFEDWELSLRLSARGRVLMVNEPLHLFQKTPGSLFSNERNYIPNLLRILDLHGDRLREHPAIWAKYCNLLGQTICQFDQCAEGRDWFRRALAAKPTAPRTWANLMMSFLGSATFRGYVQAARKWRARVAAPVRPILYQGKG